MKLSNLIPMLLLCACLVSLMAGSAFAQGYGFGESKSKISNDTANAFFSECTRKMDPMMSGDSQMEMCACMAVQLQASMTFEEYSTIKEEPLPGSKEYSKFLIYVHGPCLEYPVKDYTETTCLNDKRYRGYTPNITKMCRCISNSMATYARLYAPDILSAIFKNNPYFEDAMSPLLNSPEFMTEKRETVQECLKDQDWDKWNEEK